MFVTTFSSPPAHALSFTNNISISFGSSRQPHPEAGGIRRRAHYNKFSWLKTWRGVSKSLMSPVLVGPLELPSLLTVLAVTGAS